MLVRTGGESIVTRRITFGIIITLLICAVTTAYGFGSRPSRKIPPSANAGPDQTVEEGVIATLDGSATTERDSSIRSYLWTKTSGPSVTLSNPSAILSTFIVPKVSAEGSVLTFRLTVTDNRGLQTSDTCVVTISFINKSPIADAGKTQEVLEGDTVRLSAAKSSDPDDGIKSFRWTQSSGISVVLSSKTSVTPSFYVPDVGKDGDSLRFKLTVKDNGGLTSSASCIVNVSYKNKVPVADAGADQIILEGATAMLNGANSSDTDGDNLSYIWSQIDGTKVVLSNPSIVTPSFNVPDVGTGGDVLKFKLIVTDQEGLASIDTCLVNVLFVNEAPVAEAGDNQTVKEGDIVKLNAGDSIDADDGIVSYFWEQVAGPDVKLSDPFEINPSFMAPDVGEDGLALTFRLTTTDQGGLKSTDACIVNVSFVNVPPVANAGATQIVSEGSFTTLNAGNSMDHDSNIQSYLWEQIDGPEVKLSNVLSVRPTFVAPDTDVEGVSLTFKVTVRDKGGLASSDTCSVNVVFVNQAPVAEAGDSQTVKEGDIVKLNAGDSIDADDGIVSYLWEQVAGPDVKLSDPFEINPSFMAPDVGEDGLALTFRLTTTDQGGLKSTDACIVNVSFVNVPPVANAGATQIVSEGSLTTLNAGNSMDQDSNIQSYLWEQIDGPEVKLSNVSSVRPTFVAPNTDVEGVGLTFKVTVSDKGGLASSDTCSVQVVFVNQAPVAEAGASQTAEEGSTVILNATGSVDLDDGIQSYLWTQIAGPDVTLSNTSSTTPELIAPDVDSEGISLTFRLTVTDNSGLQSSDACIVNVTYVNIAPVADDGTTAGGKSITLEWDANEGADYYVVYWGQISGDYSNNSSDIKTPATSYTVSGLEEATYYFAVKAFNYCGNACDFSTELSLKMASVSSAVASSEDSKPSSETGFVQSLPDGLAPDGKAEVTDDEIVQPISPDSLISFLNNNPSIEFLDSDLKHIEWIQTGWAEYNNLNGEARIAAGDIDGDGEDEIIIGFGNVPGHSDIPGGFFQILDHDFTHLAWGQINWPEYNTINGESWPACGDIDDDGDDEIIIGLGKGGEGTIEIFDYDTNGLFHIEWVISSWSEYNGLIGETRPSAGDLDGDGFEEIIVGFASTEENNSIPNGYFEIIESDLTHASWGSIEWAEYNTINGETWLSCGDITGNGSYEIIAGLGTGSNGQVEIFEYLASEVLHMAWFQVDWAEYNGLNGETHPTASDIDNDGKDEIILGLGPVDSNTSIPGGRYQVNDDDYSLLEWLQLDWATYNTINGSTRPVSAVINDNQAILIGLGEK